MHNSGAGTLLLATLLSIVGWVSVTLYGNTEDLKEQQQKLAIKVNTLEITKFDPSTSRVTLSALAFISSEINKVEDHVDQVRKDLVQLEQHSKEELDELDFRLDTHINMLDTERNQIR